jgi:hypothetical protein
MQYDVKAKELTTQPRRWEQYRKSEIMVDLDEHVIKAGSHVSLERLHVANPMVSFVSSCLVLLEEIMNWQQAAWTASESSADASCATYHFPKYARQS